MEAKIGFGIIEPKPKSSLTDHYGVKEEEIILITQKMMCDMIMSNTKAEVLDKWFPTLSANDRCKVEAYKQASRNLEQGLEP